MSSRPSVAVIGSGIAGLSAAWLLSQKYDVTLYEKEARIGGHSHTVEVDYDGAKIPVDTGFIVFNHATYPNLVALFKHLGVETIKSNMSFGVSVGQIEYASHNMLSVFANPLMVFCPSFIRMLLDIVKFNREAQTMLTPDVSGTLGEFLDKLKLKSWFRKYYLLPMAGAIWSCPLETMMAYPAKTFLTFFSNHGLLSVNQHPQWFTVRGGSREYIKKMLPALGENVRVSSPVRSVVPGKGAVTVLLENGESENYDHVVIAAHGDQALSMLSHPTQAEKEVLGKFTYQKNRAVLHRDVSLMPKRKRAWASWVYTTGARADGASALSVSYWMNRLQSIDKSKPLLVTLNPVREPAKDKVFGEYLYDHPVFDQGAIDAQARLPAIQGKQNIWFCGSYHRYGFHEDALMSSVDVANCLGVKAPWQ